MLKRDYINFYTFKIHLHQRFITIRYQGKDVKCKVKAKSKTFSNFSDKNISFSAAKRFLGLSAMLIGFEITNQTVASLFRKTVAKHPHKTAFLLEDRKITFREVKTLLGNPVATYFMIFIEFLD